MRKLGHTRSSTSSTISTTVSQLATGARQQLDITELQNEIQRHPNQPENLYMLVEAYLKAGKLDDARNTIQELDKLSCR